MNLKTIAGVALALLLLTGTAAALPGAAPAQADDHANDASDASDAAEDDRDAADGANASTDDVTAADDHANDAAGQPPVEADRGPPSDVPAPVPDFVGDVHGAVNDFLAGDGEGSLGDTISDLTPGDEDAAQPGGADETATPA